ncbi:MAG: hypothetical protein ACLPX9_15465 [Rhodomicrobium sp.]
MVMRIRLRPLALAALLTPLAAGGSQAAASQQLEPVIAAEPTPAGIDVTVETGGCTDKADFDVTASPVKDGKSSVELRRKAPDTCKGNFPDGLKLQYTWAELKLPQGTQVSVKNPLEPVFAVEPVKAAPAIESRKTGRHHCGKAGRHHWASRHRHGWRRHHRHRHFHKHRGHCHCVC